MYSRAYGKYVTAIPAFLVNTKSKQKTDDETFITVLLFFFQPTSFILFSAFKFNYNFDLQILHIHYFCKLSYPSLNISLAIVLNHSLYTYI